MTRTGLLLIFGSALANDFSGAFSDIVFAITDWS